MVIRLSHKAFLAMVYLQTIFGGGRERERHSLLKCKEKIDVYKLGKELLKQKHAFN